MLAAIDRNRFYNARKSLKDYVLPSPIFNAGLNALVIGCV